MISNKNSQYDCRRKTVSIIDNLHIKSKEWGGKIAWRPGSFYAEYFKDIKFPDGLRSFWKAQFLTVNMK